MLKNQELRSPTSCLNSAMEFERVFVLLARDASAPVAIRAWVAHRLRTNKNKPTDAAIVEARRCVEQMEKERNSVRKLLGKEPTKISRRRPA